MPSTGATSQCANGKFSSVESSESFCWPDHHREASCWRNIAISLIGSEDTMIEDLFDLIGGRSAIEAATELFYDKVLHDDSLRHFF